MRLITTMLALLLASSGAWAEWMGVSKTDKAVFYIDPATIRKDGNLRKVWEVTDYRSRAEKGHLSFRSRKEYDCKLERFRFLSGSEHTGQMATGETINSYDASSPWFDIPPNSSSEHILKIVCDQ